VSMVANKALLTILILPCALFLVVRPVCAQEESQTPLENKPKPAGASTPLATGFPQDQEVDNNSLTPDSNPLTGVQTPTLGTPPVEHSYWVPGIQWSGSVQSNSYNQTPSSGWIMNNYVIGNLSLLQVWRHSQLSVNYSGGGYFSSDSVGGNGAYQQLALSQTFQWNRWLVQFLDGFSYLPASAFGFGGGTGLGLPGTSGSLGPVIPGIGSSYLPNQSIYSAIGNRYSNASTVQVTYQTSPRGSITLSGTYGLLNFVEAGNYDNYTATGTAGYNYSLTRKDTIGVFYRFSAYHYPDQAEAYGDQSVNLAYGRKLTGRLGLQLYAGPDFTHSRGTLNTNSRTNTVNAGANLSLSFKNGGFFAGYSHGVSGGSGILIGASSDFLNFGANRKLGRIWSGQINGGYSHNAPISNGPQANSQTYNTWNAGGGVNRPIGRNASFAIAYNATVTNYALAGCVGNACSSNQTFSYITINFQWHTRPFVLP